MNSINYLNVGISSSNNVPGQWIAWCPELDLISQGNSIKHVIEMVEEAIIIILKDDLQQGLDPYTRGSECPECIFSSDKIISSSCLKILGNEYRLKYYN